MQGRSLSCHDRALATAEQTPLMTYLPHTVLVVEDEPLVRMNISDHLSEAGFRVIEAGNAAEALLLLESDTNVRLIFTDVDMPGSMDGLTLASVVADRWSPVRIIITSGHRLVEITDIPPGSVFFPKPYSESRVESAMRDLLG